MIFTMEMHGIQLDYRPQLGGGRGLLHPLLSWTIPYLYSLIRLSSASCSGGDASPSSTPINAPLRSFVKRSLKDVLHIEKNDSTPEARVGRECLYR